MKKILFVLFIFSLLVFSGCGSPTGQVVKDAGEIENEEPEKPVCSNECSTETCSGFDYIACLEKSDGCKYEENKGKVKGKCSVECISNSDCGNKEKCENYECITQVGYSRFEPATKDTPLTTEVSGWLDNFKATITLTDFKRGSTAWSRIIEANMFNDKAGEGKEYLLAKIKFELLETKDNEAYDIGTYNFKVVSKSGVVYDDPFIVEPEPSLSQELYPGASHEGWIAFEVDKSDDKPLLSFNRDEEGALWFKLY